MRPALLNLFLFLSISVFGQFDSLVSGYKFLALGDSYTIGTSVQESERWPAQLVDSLASRGILNSELTYIARNGWRTNDLGMAISASGTSNDYDLVSLLIGVNDQYQNRSVSSYRNNFRVLLSTALFKAGNNKQNVFVLSIPDYAYTPFGQLSSNPQLISQDLDSFNIVNKFIADSFGVEYYNVTDISRLGLLRPNLVATDGLHPSALQYSLWIDRILNDAVISKIRKTLDEEDLFYFNSAKNYLQKNSEAGLILIYDLKGRKVLELDQSSYINLKPGLYFAISLGGQGQFQRQKILIN